MIWRSKLREKPARNVYPQWRIAPRLLKFLDFFHPNSLLIFLAADVNLKSKLSETRKIRLMCRWIAQEILIYFVIHAGGKFLLLRASRSIDSVIAPAGCISNLCSCFDVYTRGKYMQKIVACQAFICDIRTHTKRTKAA